MLLPSASCSGYSVGMCSSTLSNASALSCAMRWTVLPMRTQMAGTQLNENAFIWSSATTMSASAFFSTKRSPIFAMVPIAVSLVLLRLGEDQIPDPPHVLDESRMPAHVLRARELDVENLTHAGAVKQGAR